MGFAVRKVLVSVDAAAELGVWLPVLGVPSSLEGSGVVGRLLNWLLKFRFGRSNDVRDGDGGRGVGGRP